MKNFQPDSPAKRISGTRIHRVNVKTQDGKEDSYAFSQKENAVLCVAVMRARPDVVDVKYLDPDAPAKAEQFE